MPNKRVYSISIFRFFPTLLALFPPYLICKFSTLLIYWALFFTVLIYLPILFYEIHLKYPPYLFIWPYLFNWHLRVRIYLFLLMFLDYLLHFDNYWIDVSEWKITILSTEKYCGGIILLCSCLCYFVVWNVRSVFQSFHHNLSLHLFILWENPYSS